MLMRLRWWLIKKLAPKPELVNYNGAVHIGKCMVLCTPKNLEGFMHDATRVFHCAGYTYLFYADVEEWRLYRKKPTRVQTWDMTNGSKVSFVDTGEKFTGSDHDERLDR